MSPTVTSRYVVPSDSSSTRPRHVHVPALGTVFGCLEGNVVLPGFRRILPRVPAEPQRRRRIPVRQRPPGGVPAGGAVLDDAPADGALQPYLVRRRLADRVAEQRPP